MTAHHPQNEPSRGDQYLWDASGEADPAVARLERALAPLRCQPAPLPARRLTRMSRPRWRAPWLRAAAVLALSIAGIAAMSLFSTSLEDMSVVKQQRNEVSADGWSVVALQGSPRVGSVSVSDRSLLRVGDWVETDAQSKAEIQVGDIGRVTVDPHSRLRIVNAHADEHRMELARGRIDAFITAPPRLFLVDTPAATAVDLGCSYTLEVDEGGAGLLAVTLGWVSLEWGGRESIVPRKAQCQTRPGVGPGTPMFDDGPDALRAAVEQLDFGAGGSAALAVVMQTARDRDSLTLWHLMVRENDASERARLVDRLILIKPLPAGVQQEDVLQGNDAALLKWRDEFSWSPPFVPPRVAK